MKLSAKVSSYLTSSSEESDADETDFFSKLEKKNKKKIEKDSKTEETLLRKEKSAVILNAVEKVCNKFCTT